MLRLSRLILLLGALWLAAESASAQRDMLHIACRYIDPGSTVSADSAEIERTALRMWRLGPMYFRLESPPDSATGGRAIFLITGRHSWAYYTDKNEASYQADTSRNEQVTVAVFPETTPAIEELQFGHEQEFFERHNARKSQDATIGGVACEVQVVTVNRARLTLYTDTKKGLPVQLSMKRGDKVQAVRYDVYRPNLMADLSLFTLPDSVKVVEEVR